jgi:alpha-beta hydrolase superfamily lysophospholipase
MHEQTMVDSHGATVFSRSWPVESPRGLVVIAHGASEHSGRYDRFAKALNASGFAVVAIDHRGHGYTGKSTGPGVMGTGGGQAVVDDLHELRAASTSSVPAGTPVFLFGHSMGSLIGLAYLAQHAEGLAGGVLCGFAADVNDAATTASLLQGFADAGMRDQPAADLLARKIRLN